MGVPELPPRPAAVLFDMDGTLVDSDAAVERAWRDWASGQGLEPDRVAALAQGPPAVITIARLRPGWDRARIREQAELLLEAECRDLAGVRATAGAARTVALVAELGLPWAVVTSANTRLARLRLAAAGIDPPVLVTIDDVPLGKPDPAGYLLAARRLGVDPARCLVVEDTDTGVAAGWAAGARVAAVKGRRADVRLADLHQLAELLHQAYQR